ncbi:MAG: hypothetical protein EOP87_00215 [Verrucomicrobiaceae bacterium]|nr:MAG: hypothetical protein EOP87_00215 [Verrucomicrobiaceae bacterium]
MHPALPLKQVLAEYLRTYRPPGADEDTPPVFSEDSGFVVVHDEDLDAVLDSAPPSGDLLIFEGEKSEELAEGLGVWQCQLSVSLAMPGDLETSVFRERQDDLWNYLSGKYAGDVSTGGDAPGPLAGRLNALSAALTADDPQTWPRILAVGDVWGMGVEKPDADSPSLRVMIISFSCLAEVMPPQFIPT